MQKIFLSIVFIGLLSQNVSAANLCEFYPHWNCNDPDQAATLQQIETFITNHPQRGIAAFDWDGTLYNEKIPNPDKQDDLRAGQSIWHIWAANHLASYPYLFPAYKTSADLSQQASDIKLHDSYLEGKLVQEPEGFLTPSGYDKFSQIATFENDMSLDQMQTGINAYLHDYAPENYAFKKMLDIAQRFFNTGFDTWIVTGSNPYYVSGVINNPNGVNQTLNYRLFPQCSILKPLMANCNIAGNGAKLTVDGNHFSNVYDDRFVKDVVQPNRVTIIDGYGKELALFQRSLQTSQPVVFYAGNSDGDFAAMSSTLYKSADALGVFVQPSPTKSPNFSKLLHSSICKDRCIDVENPN